MYQYVSKLILYRNLFDDSIIHSLSNTFYELDQVSEEQLKENIKLKQEFISCINQQIGDLLQVATTYGFDNNLWQNYITYKMVTSENPFSISSEGIGAREGSIKEIACSDLSLIKELFWFDFTTIEKRLGVNIFQLITNYSALSKDIKSYNHNVSVKVRELSNNISKCNNAWELYDVITLFYKESGVGKLGLNKAFRINNDRDIAVIEPITNTENILLTDLIGYEIQKKKLIDNTEAFVLGKKANNVLLFGDSGTGKSTCVKAILNEYYSRGLRMIEIYKHQFRDLSQVISQIKNRNYKFIIFMDDLSFEEFEIEYKYLKAMIEGGLETKPDNVLIYATSNRRHLIRETWTDRSDISKDELHRSDTMQEKLSLVSRFGVTIGFLAPNKNEFNEIVKGIAKNIGDIGLTEEELYAKANMWELSHGGRSGRTAKQFIHYLIGQIVD